MHQYPRHPNQSVGNPMNNIDKSYRHASIGDGEESDSYIHSAHQHQQYRQDPPKHRQPLASSSSSSHNLYRRGSDNNARHEEVFSNHHHQQQQRRHRQRGPFFHSLMALCFKTEPQPSGFNYILCQYSYHGKFTSMDKNSAIFSSTLCFHKLRSLFQKWCGRNNKVRISNKVYYTASTENNLRSRKVSKHYNKKVEEGSVFCFLSLIFGRKKKAWEKEEEEEEEDNDEEDDEDEIDAEQEGEEERMLRDCNGVSGSDEQRGVEFMTLLPSEEHGKKREAYDTLSGSQGTIHQSNNEDVKYFRKHFTITVGPHWPGLIFLIGLIVMISNFVITSKAFTKLHVIYSYIIYLWSSLVLISLLQCGLTNPGYIVNYQNLIKTREMKIEEEEMGKLLEDENERRETLLLGRNKPSLSVVLEEEEQEGQEQAQDQPSNRMKEVYVERQIPLNRIDHQKNHNEDIELKIRRSIFNNKRLNYCDFCREYFPINFYHCMDCGCCIEKLDHHCPWIGRCIGAKNMKFFIRFNLFWITEVAYVFLILLQDS